MSFRSPGRASPLLLLGILAVLAGAIWSTRESILLVYGHLTTAKPVGPAQEPLWLRFGKDAEGPGELLLPVAPMIDLDGKPKSEILAMRKEHVGRHAGLAAEAYEPSETVFGQIVDGAPWWGLKGWYIHGAGQQSIEGPSPHSRYLMNPFILVGVGEANAYSRPDLDGSVEPEYMRPLELRWRAGEAGATAVFRLSDHFSYMAARRYMDSGRTVELIAYNARDFGLGFLSVDEAFSENISLPHWSPKAIRIVQFIHRGGSCGYPGGCNNMSPLQPELLIEVRRLPAKVHVKLWRDEPWSVGMPADFIFVIELN